MRYFKKWVYLFAFIVSAKAQAWNALYDPPALIKKIPLSISVNTQNCPDGIEGMAAAAAQLWNRVTTSYMEVEIKGSNSYTPTQAYDGDFDGFIIVCDPSFSTTTGTNNRGIAATIAEDTTMARAAILLNMDSTGDGTFLGDDSTGQTDTIAHEMGHVLGLGHSANSKSVMYVEGNRQESLEPSQDDHNGLTALYPRSEFGSDGRGEMYGCGTIVPRSGGSGPTAQVGFALFWILIVGFTILLRPSSLAGVRK